MATKLPASGEQIEHANQFPWKAKMAGDRFQNLCTDFVPGWREVLRWKLGFGPSENIPKSVPDPFRLQPSPLNLDVIYAPNPTKIVATWLGHSTFLLQIGGRAYLTDPIFSNYCSPIPVPNFRRSVLNDVSVENLPTIDAVLLSHNHFDHLDRPSLRAVGHRSKIFCPSGLRECLRRWGFTTVTELSWGDCVNDGEVRITAVPTQHGSARTPFDRNRTLWCGWLIEYRDMKALFLGDTGYAPFFREFADYFGPIDLAMIPIGAYRPAWFMRPLHLSPEEAVLVHRELRARRSIAMHWGTFRLSDEPLDEPPRLLRESLALHNIPEVEFQISQLNATIDV